MGDLPNDIADLIKDGLRRVRYAIRKRGLHPDAADDPLRRGAREIAGLADGFLSQGEHAALDLLRGERARPAPARLADEARDLALLDSGQFDRIFANLHYHLMAGELTRLGADNLFIAKHRLSEVARKLRADHPALLVQARKTPRDTEAQAALAAASCLGLITEAPIRRLDLPDTACPLADAPTLSAALTSSLTIAICATRDLSGNLGLTACADSAEAVVMARLARLRTAIAAEDPVGNLAREYASVLPFLP